jgi:Fur family peroxide stress response transcriptional regulator
LGRQFIDRFATGSNLQIIKPPSPVLTGKERLESKLATSGLRNTRQRQKVFEVVADSHDHPTAEDIFERTKARMPEISFATVYNCLSVLVQCGLVKEVTLDRAPTRFCPNMKEHCHFFCDNCGRVTDIPLPSLGKVPKVPLPVGFTVSSCDMSLRGTCSECQENKGYSGVR